MILIEWRDEFSLGVAAIDHEHQELIELINRAAARFCEQGAGTTAVVEGLGEIHNKVSAHFALEEKIMRERRYDGYTAHKADHERLLDDIRDIMDELEDGQPFDKKDFSLRLERWFTEHFRTEDARLHRLSIV